MFKNCEKTAYITNPYFIPDEEMMDLMADAVKRGVDVRVLTNSDKINDMEIATHAGRLNYKRLLNDGIRIYEMQPHESGHRRTLHSKIAVFDGVCSTIGSSNIDNLSFGINSENNAVFFDPGKGREMNEVFIKDCSMAKEFTLDTLKEFSFGDYAEQYIYNKFFKKIL
jgi:cardiolipin synthase